MLIAARSSQDFACCWRATESARSKYASAFAVSGRGDLSAISPAMRLTSASNHLSPVVSIAVIASPMHRQASSNRPRSAYALAKDNNRIGPLTIVPRDRKSVRAEEIIWTASEALRVRPKSRPRCNFPDALQYGIFFICQCNKFIYFRIRCPVISAEDVDRERSSDGRRAECNLGPCHS